MRDMARHGFVGSMEVHWQAQSCFNSIHISSCLTFESSMLRGRRRHATIQHASCNACRTFGTLNFCDIVLDTTSRPHGWFLYITAPGS